jgi:hypothetical protein
MLTAWRPTFPAYLLSSVVLGLLFAISVGTNEKLGAFALPLMLIVVFLNVACMSMTLRLALTGEFEGVIGLKFGGDEGRLLLAQLIFGALMAFVAIITGFLIYTLVFAYIYTTIPDAAAIQDDQHALQAAIIAAFQTPTGRIVSLIGIVAFLVPVVWLAARLVTYPAATISRRKIMIFETWRWTSGLAIPVMISLVICIGPLWFLTQFGQWVTTSLIGLPWIPLWDETIFASVTFIQAFVIGLIAGLLSIPMNLAFSGLSAFMRQGFDPDA